MNVGLFYLFFKGDIVPIWFMEITPRTRQTHLRFMKLCIGYKIKGKTIIRPLSNSERACISWAKNAGSVLKQKGNTVLYTTPLTYSLLEWVNKKLPWKKRS